MPARARTDRAEPIPRADLLEAVFGRRDEWVRTLLRLAALETPSTDPASQIPFHDLVGAELGSLGFRVRRIRGATRVRAGSDSRSPLLLAAPELRRKGAHQLLLGHTDTVWPMGTVRTMPVEADSSVVRGPGVLDMKAGIANLLLALRVLRDLRLEPVLPPVVLLDSDEEIGSPSSMRAVRRLARGADRAFVLEPALGVDGKLKTLRKGAGTFTISVHGRGAHAGLDPEKGASAVHEMASVVRRVAELSDPARGLTLNVGTVRGGTRPNVIAERATAEVDLRFDSLEQGMWASERIHGLVTTTPGCRIGVAGGIDRPPLERTERNRALWTVAREVGREMGIALEEGAAGGTSDGNTASLLTATLDGLGAVGDGAHAAHEHVRIEPTLERVALLAALLLAPPVESGPVRS